MKKQTLEQRFAQIQIDSLNGEYGWENAVETASIIAEAEGR